MKKTTGALAILALTNGFVLGVVACAPAPPPSNSSSDSNLTPKKGASSASGSASGTGTPAPSGSTPTTENGGADGGETEEEGEDPNEAAAIAKFMACVSQNPAAKAMADRANACFETCQDEACETRCDATAAQDCQTDQAACNIVLQCEDQAFPESGEGEAEGTGNED